MTIFDCDSLTQVSPGQKDADVIRCCRVTDETIKELQLYHQDMVKLIGSLFDTTFVTIEKLIASNQTFIRSQIDRQILEQRTYLQQLQTTLTTFISQVLTEVIVTLRVVGVPISDDQELQLPPATFNTVNNYGSVAYNTYNIVESISGPTSIVAPAIGGDAGNGNQIRPSGGSIAPFLPGPNRQPAEIGSGSSTGISNVPTQCNQGDVTIVVSPDGSQFYGSIVGFVEGNFQPIILIIGPVTNVDVRNSVAVLLDGQGATALGEQPATLFDLPEFPTAGQRPLVGNGQLGQSPQLQQVATDFPVDLQEPLAWQFYGGRNVQWKRSSVRWMGGDAERLLFPESLTAGRELLDSKLVDNKFGE